MYEALKTNTLRGPEFLEKYFSSRVIDFDSGSAMVVSAEFQDAGYDHTLKRIGTEGIWSKFLRQRYNHLIGTLSQRKMLTLALMEELNRMVCDQSATVDQTMGSALAQIRIVIHQRPEA